MSNASTSNAVKKIIKIIVHSGIFHADDALSVALVRIAHPEVEIERSFSVPEGAAEDPSVIVADIGGGRYDHHQEDARKRASGVRYAACGLIFERKDVRSIFPTEDAAVNFERDFIIPVEETDNGFGKKNPLSLAVSSMNPSWDSEEKVDDAFLRAVDFLEDIVRREIDRAKSVARAEEIVSNALAEAQNGIVVLPRFAPWAAVLVPSTAQFVIFPGIRGGYVLRTIPQGFGVKDVKVQIPGNWLSHKPDGCTFVHHGLFMASFSSEQAAVKAAKVLCDQR